jgi:hypothetical protein
MPKVHEPITLWILSCLFCELITWAVLVRHSLFL